jgi:hypothetical protein
LDVFVHSHYEPIVHVEMLACHPSSVQMATRQRWRPQSSPSSEHSPAPDSKLSLPASVHTTHSPASELYLIQDRNQLAVPYKSPLATVHSETPSLRQSAEPLNKGLTFSAAHS